MESLHDQAKALSAAGQVIGAFLSRYQEFVALDAPVRMSTRR
jgi:hypothetical protein